MENLIQLQYCYDGLLSVISPSLLLYSHIPTAIVAILFGIFLFFKNRGRASKAFFILCLSFAIWSFLDLNAWFSFLGAENTMFSWSIADIFALIFFYYAYRFLYAYFFNADIPIWQSVLAIVLMLPTLVSTFFGWNLLAFDTLYCEAIEHEQVTLYPYIPQLIAIGAIICITFVAWIRARELNKKKEIVSATIGVLLFLLFFSTATFVVAMLTSYTTIENPYNYEIYGLFGMPILLLYLGYLIVKFRAFELRVLGAQAIIAALALLVGSQIFFTTTTSSFVIHILTFVLTIVFGFFLIRSVKREIKAREREEVLVQDLARVNVRLRELDRQKSEFVSIASHQLRSPLTAIRGYASLILEGSFGKIPAKAQEAIERIHESSGFMALSIEDFLNVSRIEQGRMKYEFADTNVREMTSKVVDELRSTALKKGLVFLFRSQCEGGTVANVDPGKLRQIIYNLADNAMKYTQKGSVTVTVTDDAKAKKIRVAISDTGVGMSEETLHKIFDKFVRAKNANAVNVTGTGLGLYVAKQMVEAMRGKIIPASEGEGKGSTFTIELPMV